MSRFLELLKADSTPKAEQERPSCQLPDVVKCSHLIGERSKPECPSVSRRSQCRWTMIPKRLLTPPVHFLILQLEQRRYGLPVHGDLRIAAGDSH